MLLFSSCCEKHGEIKYKCNGIVITRIDVCGKTSFYYRNEKEETAGVIYAKYSGMSGGFRAYLDIQGEKANIIFGDGYFQAKNLDTTKFNFYRWEYGMKKPDKWDTFCQLDVARTFEKRENNEHQTGIEIEYSEHIYRWWWPERWLGWEDR